MMQALGASDAMTQKQESSNLNELQTATLRK